MKKEEPVDSGASCKNCGGNLPPKVIFCPHCGQRNFDGRVHLKQLGEKIFHHLTHLDNKFIRTLKVLFIPGLLTRQYFTGRIKSYPHPLQMFFVTMFFFVLVFSPIFQQSSIRILGRNNTMNISGLKSTCNQAHVDNINFWENLQKLEVADRLRDSVVIQSNDTTTRKRIDTVYNQQFKDLRCAISEFLDLGNTLIDSIPMSLLNYNLVIERHDFIYLSPDSIIQKYGYENWWEKLLIKQGIKSVKDSDGIMKRILASFVWSVLLQIVLMSILLQVLYFRRQRFFVEHLIFLLHWHTASYLILTVATYITIHLYDPGNGWYAIWAWILLSLLLAMKRYYEQGWPKTFLKTLIFFSLYFGVFVFGFIASILLVFMLF
jgi:hypothetical protein